MSPRVETTGRQRTALAAAPIPRWLVTLLVLVLSAGIAWGVAQKGTSDLADRVAKVETTQATDHDVLQRVDQHVNDMNDELKEALAHLPRK